MIRIIFLFLLFFLQISNCFSQKTPSTFLSAEISNVRLGDSCFSGFYYIKFMINTNFKSAEIQFSSDMPIPLRNAIKSKLDSSLKFLEKSIVYNVIKNNKQILIPIMCFNNYDCRVRANNYLDSLNFDSTGTTIFQENFLNAKIISLTRSNAFLKNSFENCMNIDDAQNYEYFDGIILAPCLIDRKAPAGMKY